MQIDRRPKVGLGKWMIILTMVIAPLAAPSLLSQDGGQFDDPNTLWFRAYQLLQEGLKTEEAGRDLETLSKFNEAKVLFDGLAREFPEFHPSLVEYRRTQLVQKIGGLKNRMRQQAQNKAPNYAQQGVPQPDQGPGSGNLPNVQPASPEFPLSGNPVPNNGNTLPAWNQAPTTSPTAPSTVVRPPVNPAFPPQGQATTPWNNPAGTLTDTGSDEDPFRQIQRQHDRMREQIDHLKERNRQLESDLAKRQSDLYEAQNQLTASEQRTAQLRKQLEQAEARGGSSPDSQSEIEGLRQILSEALGELEKSNQEKKELLAQLRSTQNDLERIKRQRDDLEKERNHLVALMEGGGESAAVAELMAENSELKARLEEVEASAIALQTDNEDKTVQIALLKEQIDQIKSEREKLVSDNLRYEGHIQELRDRLKQLGQEVTEGDLANVASASPEVAAENELLRKVVLKQLRRQSQVQQTKALLLRELDKLGARAENLYAMVEDIANGPALSEEEREMFKTPEMAELVESAGIERVDGVILVEGVESDGSGTGIVETQDLEEELIQIQKAARLDYSEGRYAESEEAYRKYLEFRPKSVVCLCNLALVKMATGDHEEAEDLLEKAVAIKSDYGLAYYLMGRNEFAQGNFDVALERLNESIHYDPENARAHNCVGVISSQKGFVNRAEGAFNEAVKIDPKFGDAHFNLAVLYATMDRPDPVKAESHYERAIDLGVPRDTSIEHYLQAARVSTASVTLR